MRVVVQRVARAEVRLGERLLGRIQAGMAVLVGVSAADTLQDVRYLAEKVANLRVFPDTAEPDRRNMNRSVLEAGGGVLVVTQFTLYGDCRRGRRPSFDRAAPPVQARPLCDAFVEALRELVTPVGGTVETGEFQAMIELELVNDGPVTLLLDSEKLI